MQVAKDIAEEFFEKIFITDIVFWWRRMSLKRVESFIWLVFILAHRNLMFSFV